MLEMLLAGAAVAAIALAVFWDKVKNWLNNTAANAVERVLGYGARQQMQKAVCTADRLFGMVRVSARIFTKPNVFSSARVVNVELEMPEGDVGQTVLNQMTKDGCLMKEIQF